MIFLYRLGNGWTVRCLMEMVLRICVIVRRLSMSSASFLRLLVDFGASIVEFYSSNQWYVSIRIFHLSANYSLIETHIAVKRLRTPFSTRFPSKVFNQSLKSTVPLHLQSWRPSWTPGSQQLTQQTIHQNHLVSLQASQLPLTYAGSDSTSHASV